MLIQARLNGNLWFPSQSWNGKRLVFFSKIKPGRMWGKGVMSKHVHVYYILHLLASFTLVLWTIRSCVNIDDLSHKAYCYYCTYFYTNSKCFMVILRPIVYFYRKCSTCTTTHGKCTHSLTYNRVYNRIALISCKLLACLCSYTVCRHL